MARDGNRLAQDWDDESTASDSSSAPDIKTEPSDRIPKSGIPGSANNISPDHTAPTPETPTLKAYSSHDDFMGEPISFPSSQDIQIRFHQKYHQLCDERGIRLKYRRFNFAPSFQVKVCEYMVQSHYFSLNQGPHVDSTLEPFYQRYGLRDPRKDARARGFFINEIEILASRLTKQVLKGDGYTVEVQGPSETPRKVMKFKRGFEYIAALQDWDGIMRRKFLDPPDLELALRLLTPKEKSAALDYLLKSESQPTSLTLPRTPISELKAAKPEFTAPGSNGSTPMQGRAEKGESSKRG